MTQWQGYRAQTVKTFFGLHLHLAERFCKIPRSAEAPHNNMVSKRNDLLHHFLIGSIHIHLASFYATKYFWKRKIGYKKCSLNKLLNLNWKGPLGRTTGYFHDKTKISKKNLSGSLFTAKYCRREYTSLPPTWAKSLTKFNPKCTISNMFWT